jgi:hypothetical protein
VRVLVTNAPRGRRAALAPVLRKLRAAAEVVDAEPEALDREQGRQAPYLVICSRTTAGATPGPSLTRTRASAPPTSPWS